ncbi:IclR family transcriptional regulator domain-containing protein [Streptomyces sp. NPDC002623]|uniref:IclR family transcriptional regulator domain-containing protein n=1 Tax=unclassified Streptomyces TaxID=2593676 RepID=UPI003325978D
MEDGEVAAAQADAVHLHDDVGRTVIGLGPVVDRLDPTRRRENSCFHLWAGTSSKILLRDASPDGVEDLSQLRAWTEDAAQRGYAVSSSEWDEGLTAVAVPVTAGFGRVIASLSISGPSQRFPYEAVERFVADLAEAATLISAQGFSHPLSQGR